MDETKPYREDGGGIIQSKFKVTRTGQQSEKILDDVKEPP